MKWSLWKWFAVGTTMSLYVFYMSLIENPDIKNAAIAIVWYLLALYSLEKF